jgi:hypothetical protein
MLAFEQWCDDDVSAPRAFRGKGAEEWPGMATAPVDQDQYAGVRGG